MKTKEQVNKIKELLDKGVKQIKIAKDLGVSTSCINYWINEENRLRRIEYAKNYFNKKSPEEKKKMYLSRKDYIRNYMRTRYNSDNQFKERMKKSARDYNKKSRNFKKVNK